MNRHTVIAIDWCVKYDRVMKNDNGFNILQTNILVETQWKGEVMLLEGKIIDPGRYV
jgi:hypothetical protein